MNPSNPEVLALYKGLIRYGKNLKYTDKKYFIERIREEFKKHKDDQNQEDIIFAFQRGVSLLNNKRII